jgi:hypothetical protein
MSDLRIVPPTFSRIRQLAHGLDLVPPYRPPDTLPQAATDGFAKLSVYDASLA